MWFLDFVTVFDQSYNCQTSHYLGRNRLPEPLLFLLSLFRTIEYMGRQSTPDTDAWGRWVFKNQK